MDSKLLHGAPLTVTTMAAAKVPVPGSTGIRAPLTLDDSDDFEYSASTSGKKDGIFSSENSESEFQSDGYSSGEDEFESGSKRPFVSSSDSGIFEVDHFFKKYVITKPLVKCPSQEFIQESSGVRGFNDSGPLLFDQSEEVVEDNDNLEDYIDRRPSVAAIDDSFLGTMLEEGKNASVIDSPVVDTGITALPNQGMPIAQLSWDSDDDFVGSETYEDESFSGIVKVPDAVFQEKLDNAPKVRVWDVAEVEDSASQTEYLSEVEILEEAIVEGGDNEVMNYSSEGNHLIQEEIVPDSTSAEVNEDKDPAVTEQAEILEESIMEGGDNEVMNCSSVGTHPVLEKIVPDSISPEENEGRDHIVTEQAEILEESIVEGGDIEVMSSSSEGNHLVQEETVPDSISAGVNEDKDPIVTGQAEILEESIVEGGGNEVTNSSSEGNHLVQEEIVPESISAEMNEDKNRLVTEQAEGGHLDEGIEEPDCSNLIVDHYQNMPGVVGALEEHLLPRELTEAKVIEIEAVDNFGPASGDIDSDRNQNLKASGTDFLSQSNDNEKLNEIELNDIESHDCNSFNNIESVDNANVLDILQSKNDTELSETKVDQRSECFENVHFSDIARSLVMEGQLHDESNISQAFHQFSNLEPETSSEINDDSVPTEEKEELLGFDSTQNLNFGSSEGVNTTDQLEECISFDPISCWESSENHSQMIDAMIEIDSNDEPNTNRDLQEEGASDSSALVAPQNASTGIGLAGGNGTLMSADGTRLFSLEQLASLGSAVHSLESTRLNNAILFGPPNLMASGESNESLSDEKNKLEKLQQIRVKLLRLVHRLKQSPEDSVAAKVLYQLSLALGRSSSQEFSFDFAKQAAMELEAKGKNNLDFSLNILVIGKSGVGKSATINSIFGEDKAVTSAFEPATTGLREVKGTVEGVLVRVLDTPGLRSSVMEQYANRKLLLSIKKFMKKFLPDIVLYVDRLDLQTRDLNDLPLLKSITSYLGSSIWFQTILTLTHAASTPPEGPSGNALSYDLFVAQRSHAVRQLISHSVRDLHILKPSLIPVSLVENRSRWETNESVHISPHYEESWRSRLLLSCYSMKILSEIDSIVQHKATLHRSKFRGLKVQSLPLPFFLSSLLKSSAHQKLSTTQGGEDFDSDIELAYLSDCDEESEDEYDQLPAFRPLRKSQIAKLDKEQRKAYFEEYDYRVKLLQKMQLKEEMRRARDIKKKQKEGTNNYADEKEDLDQNMESPEALAFPLPDMVFPPSFDGDNPAYRYRFMEPSSRILTRPVLDSHGWDHDYGFDGINIEDNLAIAGQFPAVITVQLRKDKKEFNIHLNSSVSAKHGEKGSTIAGLDIGTIGKQLAYTLKTETKIKSSKVNKSAAGISFTLLDGNVITGIKVEDQVAVGKNLILVGTTGLGQCQNDAAYGANLAIRLQDNDYPLKHMQHLIGLSVLRWRGDNVLGLNLQSQFSLGRNSKLGITAGLNSTRTGQLSFRISCSDDLHVAILGLLPIAKTIIRHLFAADK